ncbi:hypothetical protein NLJ89_g12278 [Agrocybe chaxingu]|uniref:Uncharacterized protein n=1 Tax=Agrocybe chaxingu TaxID=84603 RepID=A0A9W8JKA6_9AGAR|nr:hypothetical protein NLJ89_g12278 [Agrocybe chaxingu]
MDNLGPQPLWGWIRELAPRAGLETFRLQAYTFNNGDAGIPRRFVLGPGARARGDAQALPGRRVVHDPERRGVSVLQVPEPGDASAQDSIIHAIAGAMHLQTLTLQVKWIPGDARKTGTSISVEDAKRMMLRSKDSKLRTISVGHYQYTGKWVLHDEDDEKLQFIVCADKAGEGWHT